MMTDEAAVHRRSGGESNRAKKTLGKARPPGG